ncbi:MAG: phosphomannomutase, partial [Deltaproteobacteria bacterium]|nr:phosphomannomutase [Deltaproteobacteria bacterium]
LMASPIESGGKTLSPLPTRDALILHIAILLLSIEKHMTIRELVSQLPQRFTYSNRLREFPTEKSSAKIKDKETLGAIFGGQFGPVASFDTTDGLRITFESDEIVHLRPSGNAPEFRCYNEADTEFRAIEMNQICMDIMAAWR